MSKFLIVGDLHLSLHFGSIDKSELIINRLTSILSKQVSKQCIVLLGDVFDLPNPSPFHLRYFSKLIPYFKNNQVRIIMGNHDVARSSNNFSLMPFKGLFKNIDIIDKAKRIEGKKYNYVFLPYYYNDSDLELIDKKSIVFSHRDTDFNIDERFNKLPYVLNFNGHIHTPNINDENPFSYINVGSVVKYNMSEKDDDKYIISFDDDTLEYEWINIETEKMFNVIADYTKNKLIINDRFYRLSKINYEKISYIKGSYIDFCLRIPNANDAKNSKVVKLTDFVNENCYIRKYDILSLDKYRTYKTLENVDTPANMVKEYVNRFYKGEDKKSVIKLATGVLKECGLKN